MFEISPLGTKHSDRLWDVCAGQVVITNNEINSFITRQQDHLGSLNPQVQRNDQGESVLPGPDDAGLRYAVSFSIPVRNIKIAIRIKTFDITKHQYDRSGAV